MKKIINIFIGLVLTFFIQSMQSQPTHENQSFTYAEFRGGYGVNISAKNKTF